ncbi:hypothetical protein D3C87_2111740 [compost metagenome]
MAAFVALITWYHTGQNWFTMLLLSSILKSFTCWRSAGVPRSPISSISLRSMSADTNWRP